jgi:1,2-phenylacetyl-CoA epoxidase catalytic subunit
MMHATKASALRPDDLDGEVRSAVLQWTLSLADCKHKMGIRVSEWVNGGPALEAAVGASAITQDELGHARSLFAFLKGFPEAPKGIGAENDLEARDHYYCPRQLNRAWNSWLDVIAVNVLLDRALNIAVASFADSTFRPLRSRCAKILQEERFHRIFGDSWLARMAAWSEDQKEQMQAALDRHWPVALAWLGPDNDPICETLVTAGVLQQGPEQMRAKWLASVGNLLEKHALEGGPLTADWSNWDPEQRDLWPG